MGGVLGCFFLFLFGFFGWLGFCLFVCSVFCFVLFFVSLTEASSFCSGSSFCGECCILGLHT